MTRTLLLTVALIGLYALPARSANLVVHEWGTFTSLQDEAGRAVGGIVEDIEPMPRFVRDLYGSSGGKGIPASMGPLVTMRLETPVVYFHLPKDSKPVTLSFSATFHGGVISQFYPGAQSNFIADAIPPLTSDIAGSLSWDRITVGTDKPGPETTSPIWLAPRRVEAANITARNGESERYLFYRGVGHLDSPLRVVRDRDSLHIVPQASIKHTTAGSTNIQTMWYFRVDAQGNCVYRTLPSIDLRSTRPMMIPAEFSSDSMVSTDLKSMQAEMKKSLISAGLFDDEAQAMLNTWDEAYFKSPGTRLFFMVPDAWVNQHLPIKVSVPAEIKRVMIGRIDLITPEQRAIAAKYRALPNDQRNTPEATQLMKSLGRFATNILRQPEPPGMPLGSAR